MKLATCTFEVHPPGERDNQFCKHCANANTCCVQIKGNHFKNCLDFFKYEK